MDEVLQFLKDNPTYFIATEDGDQPEIRPFGTITKFEDRLYFQTGRVKACYKQMIASPRISICGWNGKGTWLRINATAVEDERVEAAQAVLDEYPELGHLYAAGDGNCTVFYLKDATARFCSFTEPERVVNF